MWILLEVICDLSESQKPTRTSPLVNVPRNPMNARTAWDAIRELDVVDADPGEVVMTSVL